MTTSTTIDLPSASARNYSREPEAERQLALFDNLAATLAAQNLLAWTGERICEEVLVTLLRRCSAEGDDDAAWRIAQVVTQRVKGRIARTLKLWRLDKPESTAEETIDEIITTLYEALFDLSAREQFWEIRFWVAFDRRMIKIMQARRSDIDTFRDTGLDDEAEPPAIAATDTPNVNFATLSDPVTGTLVGEALALLSANERTAFLLKHVAQMPEDSQRENGPLTIAQVLKVSPRTVRNYLARAEKMLSNWRQAAPHTASIRP